MARSIPKQSARAPVKERRPRRYFSPEGIKPCIGKNTVSKTDACEYYHRCKKGWPLPGGNEWKAPDFKYLLVRPKVIDMNKFD